MLLGLIAVPTRHLGPFRRTQRLFRVFNACSHIYRQPLSEVSCAASCQFTDPVLRASHSQRRPQKSIESRVSSSRYYCSTDSSKQVQPLKRANSTKVMTADVAHRERFTVTEDGWWAVREGRAEVLFPTKKDVFYNPVQEFNRDLTTAVIKQHVRHHFTQLRTKKGEDVGDAMEAKIGEAHPEGVKILEALAASGLRSIRFAKEIPGLKKIVANDWSKQAVESIHRNVKHNDVGNIVEGSNGDAAMVMYTNRRFEDRFHVIDLDPYGSPTPFLDAALQSVADGGMLCVTATDMAVLCGNTPETCYTKYGAISLKTKACHEFALRILMQCLESHANRYGRYIQPLLSLSIDFYCRVFVRVFTGQAKCKDSTAKLGHVYQCTGCEEMAYQRLGKTSPHENGKNTKYSLVTGPPVDRQCQRCGQVYHMGGPVWLDPIHDREFVSELLASVESLDDIESLNNNPEDETGYATSDRIKGMLSMALEELPDVPLYYELSRLCNILKQSQDKLTVYTSAILNAGYEFSLSHANKHGIKTTAPLQFLLDIIKTRGAEKLAPGQDPLRNLAPESPGYKIMAQPVVHQGISFERHPLANPASRQQQLKRFQINPEPNWGPKMRAKTSTVRNVVREEGSEEETEKTTSTKARREKRKKEEREQRMAATSTAATQASEDTNGSSTATNNDNQDAKKIKCDAK